MVESSGIDASSKSTFRSRTHLLSQANVYAATIVLISTLGIVLRCWQYLGKDSYFLDEVAILRNLVERSWGTLLARPLAYDQVAPPVFLILEKLMLTISGVTEYSLRLPPLLFSLLGVVVFASLSRRLLSRGAAITAVCIFATAGPLILFSAQAKQYSGDVLSTCVLLLIATKYLSERRLQHACWLGVLGAALVWFSQPAVIVFVSIAIVVLGEETLRADGNRVVPLQRLSAYLILGGVSAGASTWYATHSITRATREYLRNFWEAGFMPHRLPASLGSIWPYAQLRNFYGVRGSSVLAYPWPGAFALLTGIGMVLLVAKRKALGAIVVAPVLLTLVASAAGRYPFSDRVILFLLPCFIVAIVFATEQISLLLTRFWHPATLVALATLSAVTCFPVLRRLPTYRLQQVRRVSQVLASHRQEGSPLYVYYGIVPEFSYYGPQYGLVNRSTIIGTCHRGDTREYLREIDKLRGAGDVWFLLGNSLPLYHEGDDIVRYLDAIGVRRFVYIDEARTYGFYVPAVEAIEYDLSDPTKGRSVSAETFPVTARHSANPARPCGFGPDAIGLASN
jgi:Dolichyl-phosphate-mannose-protein mannosyltransferase